MNEPAIPQAIRDYVANRAEHCCEYCWSQQKYCPDPLSIDHIEPRSRGGSDDDSNLALSCAGCNGLKHAAVRGFDPVTDREVPLYHPRRDRWSDHFAWSNDYQVIQGVSATGRATIHRLQLNRSSVINLRLVLGAVGKHPPIVFWDPRGSSGLRIQSRFIAEDR